MYGKDIIILVLGQKVHQKKLLCFVFVNKDFD